MELRGWFALTITLTGSLLSIAGGCGAPIAPPPHPRPPHAPNGYGGVLLCFTGKCTAPPPAPPRPPMPTPPSPQLEGSSPGKAPSLGPPAASPPPRLPSPPAGSAGRVVLLDLSSRPANKTWDLVPGVVVLVTGYPRLGTSAANTTVVLVTDVYPVTSYSNNDHDVVPVLTSGVEGVPLPIRVGVIAVGINGDREGAYSKDEVVAQWFDEVTTVQRFVGECSVGQAVLVPASRDDVTDLEEGYTTADLEQVVLQNIAATAVGAGTNAPEGLRRGTCVAAALQELWLLVDNLLAVKSSSFATTEWAFAVYSLPNTVQQEVMNVCRTTFDDLSDWDNDLSADYIVGKWASVTRQQRLARTF